MTANERQAIRFLIDRAVRERDIRLGWVFRSFDVPNGRYEREHRSRFATKTQPRVIV